MPRVDITLFALQTARDIASSGEASTEQKRLIQKIIVANSGNLRKRMVKMNQNSSPLATHGGFVSRTVDAIVAP